MKTDRTSIKDPRHPEYYAEARDAIMDLCPFYDPNHKGGIVREAVFKSCLQELREREKVALERLRKLANAASVVWEEHKAFSLECNGAEGMDQFGSDSEGHEMMQALVDETLSLVSCQNDEMTSPHPNQKQP